MKRCLLLISLLFLLLLTSACVGVSFDKPQVVKRTESALPELIANSLGYLDFLAVSDGCFFVYSEWRDGKLSHQIFERLDNGDVYELIIPKMGSARLLCAFPDGLLISASIETSKDKYQLQLVLLERNDDRYISTIIKPPSDIMEIVPFGNGKAIIRCQDGSVHEYSDKEFRRITIADENFKVAGVITNPLSNRALFTYSHASIVTGYIYNADGSGMSIELDEFIGSNGISTTRENMRWIVGDRNIYFTTGGEAWICIDSNNEISLFNPIISSEYDMTYGKITGNSNDNRDYRDYDISELTIIGDIEVALGVETSHGVLDNIYLLPHSEPPRFSGENIFDLDVSSETHDINIHNTLVIRRNDIYVPDGATKYLVYDYNSYSLAEAFYLGTSIQAMNSYRDIIVINIADEEIIAYDTSKGYNAPGSIPQGSSSPDAGKAKASDALSIPDLFEQYFNIRFW